MVRPGFPPDLPADCATVLGIPAGDLAVLTGDGLPRRHPSAEPGGDRPGQLPRDA